MSDLDVITVADSARREALHSAVSATETLQQSAGDVPDSGDPSLAAFQRHRFAERDSDFWSVVQQALTVIQSNRAYSGAVPLTPRRDLDGDHAHVDESGDPDLGITFCAAFVDADFTCQREVITHENFPFVCGLVHYQGTTSPSRR